MRDAAGASRAMTVISGDDNDQLRWSMVPS